jgi:hypothetical protein
MPVARRDDLAARQKGEPWAEEFSTEQALTHRYSKGCKLDGWQGYVVTVRLLAIRL